MPPWWRLGWCRLVSAPISPAACGNLRTRAASPRSCRGPPRLAKGEDSTRFLACRQSAPAPAFSPGLSTTSDSPLPRLAPLVRRPRSRQNRGGSRGGMTPAQSHLHPPSLAPCMRRWHGSSLTGSRLSAWPVTSPLRRPGCCSGSWPPTVATTCGGCSPEVALRRASGNSSRSPACRVAGGRLWRPCSGSRATGARRKACCGQADAHRRNVRA